MTSDTPAQVRRAVALLLLSLLIGIGVAVAEWEPLPSEDQALLLTSIGIGYVLPALLIFLIWRRKNWARITLLLFTVLWTVLYLAFWNEEPVDPLWVHVATIASAALDIVALYWLFSRPASEWFRPRGVQAGAV
jgi:hypothetical protein